LTRREMPRPDRTADAGDALAARFDFMLDIR
jgi:hypothetical protein